MKRGLGDSHISLLDGEYCLTVNRSLGRYPNEPHAARRRWPVADSTATIPDHIGVQTEPLALSSNDAAALLGISRSHLWKLHSAEQIPRPVRMGRSVRWLRTDLTEWLHMGCPPREQFKQRRGGRP